VTRYDHLPETQHLAGPGNDARLMRRLLRSRFDFPADHITTLAEGEDAEGRPTRANIERAFRRLAEVTQAGDQVVVFLAGHGARQPESDPPDPKYPEPDGIDEIFLPADVKEWKGFPERVPNAIVDDDLRVWLEALTAKRAYVWAIFDCCHSGTMTRGTEVVRELPPGMLVPAEAMRQARDRADRRTGAVRGEPAKAPAFVPPAASDYLVALYACRPHETTPEGSFPPDKEDAPCHGLLTYTLVQTLEQSAASSAPLTYWELGQRIALKYATRQGAPTPLVEGRGQERVALGVERPNRPRLTLSRNRGGYRVNAGDLHGLTVGSILAVYSPAGSATPSELLGHVRVASADPLEAVVQPCAHDGKPERKDLPELAPCQVVYTDYSLRGFRVAVQVEKEKERAKDLILQALGMLADPKICLVRVVPDARSAEWVIRLEGPEPELLEASGNGRPYRLPPPESKEFARLLRDNLEAVFRARHLLAVAERLQGEGRHDSSEVDIEVEVLLQRPGDERAQVVPRPPGGWVFRPGDKVSFRIHNRSRFARLDVSLLIVNPDFKITAFYPQKDEVGKALAPGEEIQTESGSIKERPPFGPEHMVVITTPARSPPVDFSLLTHEGLKDRGYGEDSPLAQLLEQAMFRSAGRGGLGRSDVARHAMRVLSWRTEPLPGK
jgi:hypothetical protein